jgi:uncharacterized glyoxalase superfamily protein PhnB
MTEQRKQTIFPVLRYDDARGAIDFFERIGFRRGDVTEGADGSIVHAELRMGTASIGLSSTTPPRPGNPWSTARGGIYVALPDAAAVDAHHARAVRAGAQIAMPLRDTEYGSREYSVWDLDGHLWAFGSYTQATPGEPSLFVSQWYRDGRAAIEWLNRAFGFTLTLEVPGPNATIAHAELRLGDSIFMIGSTPDAAVRCNTDRQGQNLYVPDPDAIFARAVAAGATVVEKPADTSYGARGASIRDPGGYIWGFSTYRPALHESGKEVGSERI